MFSGSAVSQIMWIVSMMIMTRFYMPEEFAAYQIFISVVNVCTIFATARYELAIVVPKYRFKASDVLWLSIFTSTIVSLLLLLSVCFYFFISLEFFIEFEIMWWYMPIAVLVISIYVCLYNWFVREKKYTLISIAIIMFPISNLVCAVLFKYLCITDGLIFAMIIARFFEVLLFVIVFFKTYGRYTTFPGISRLSRCAKCYLSFPKYLIGSSALENLTSACPVFLIDSFFGREITGFYSIAMQALSAPSALVAKSVGDVFRQQVSVLYRKGGSCVEYYVKNAVLVSKGAVLLAFLLLICGPEMFEIVLGENWRISGEMAQYMIPSICTLLVAVPLSNMFIISMHQREYLSIQCMYFLVNVIGLFFGSYFFNAIRETLLLNSLLVSIIAILSIYEGRNIAMRKL